MRPQHDDAVVVRGRVRANITQAAVESYERPLFGAADTGYVRVFEAAEPLLKRGDDVMPSRTQQDRGRVGEILVRLEPNGSARLCSRASSAA